MTTANEDPVAKPRHMHITSGSMTPDEALALAKSFLQGRYEVQPLGKDPPKLSGAADFWTLEQALVTHNTEQYCCITRHPKTSIGGTVRFRLVTGGQLRGRIDGDEVHFGPGDVLFDANEAQLAVDLEAFSCICFSVSSAMIGYDPNQHLPWQILAPDDPSAVIFASAARAFLARIGTANAVEADRMGQAMLGLLRGMLERMTRGEEGPAKAVRSTKMRRFIDANLSDRDLSVETILAEFPVSRSVVYREFSTEGGVARYVLSRRMVRSLHLLMTGDMNSKIADIAAAVGIRDQRHFSRQFRKHFGMPPSDARRAFNDPTRSIDGDWAEHSDLGNYKRSVLRGSEHFSGDR